MYSEAGSDYQWRRWTCCAGGEGGTRLGVDPARLPTRRRSWIRHSRAAVEELEYGYKTG